MIYRTIEGRPASAARRSMQRRLLLPGFVCAACLRFLSPAQIRGRRSRVQLEGELSGAPPVALLCELPKFCYLLAALAGFQRVPEPV